MSTLISNFLTTVDKGTIGFLTSGASAVAKAAFVPFVNLTVFATTLWLILVVFNYIEEPFREGLKRITRIVIISSLALGSGVYVKEIASKVYSLPVALSSLFVKGSAKGPNVLIDNALEEGNKVAVAYKDQASGWMPADAFGWYLTYLLALIIVAVICFYAAIMLMVMKLALGLALVLGPAAILCYGFKASRFLFDGWVKQLLILILSYVLIIAAIALTYRLFQAQLANALVNASNGFSSFLGVGLTGLASIVLIFQAHMMARGIVGGSGWQIDTHGGIGNAWAKGTQAARGAYRAVRGSGRGSGKKETVPRGGEQHNPKNQDQNAPRNTPEPPPQAQAVTDHTHHHHHHESPADGNSE